MAVFPQGISGRFRQLIRVTVLRLNLRDLGCRRDCGLFLGFLQGGLPLVFLDGVDVVGEEPGVVTVVTGEEEADGLASE